MIDQKAGQKEKRVIKRYRNRKLYDTLESCYVTLEDIADLIRQGEEVCVMDAKTQADMTSVSLAQIILEEEKKKKDALPLATLIQLIRTGGGAIRSFVQKSLGEKAKDLHIIRDEVYDHLERLVKGSSINYDEGSRLLDNIKNFIESKIKPTMENVQNIPTVQSEVKNLKHKLSELEKKMNSYQKKR